MKVTIKTIAEHAGVSRGTVDRALNNRKGVDQAVAQRVLTIAKELGYEPNIAAKALADSRYTPKKIGVLLNSEGNPFFDEVILGVHDALQSLRSLGMQNTVKTTSGYNIEKQLSMLDELREEKVDGIVMTAANSIRITKKINQLYEAGIPVVTINTDIPNSKRIASVGCDYLKSGQVAAGLMGIACAGRKAKIGIVTGSKLVLAHESRIQGIHKATREDFTNIRIIDIVQNEESDSISYEVTKAMLAKQKDLTGIIFTAAGIVGGMKAVYESRRAGELLIITYDLTDTVKENLKKNYIIASVLQEPYKQGSLGIEIMSDYLLKGILPSKDIIYTDCTIATKYSI